MSLEVASSFPPSPRLSPWLLPLLGQLATTLANALHRLLCAVAPASHRGKDGSCNLPTRHPTTNTPSTTNTSSSTDWIPPSTQPLSPLFKCSVTLTPNAPGKPQRPLHSVAPASNRPSYLDNKCPSLPAPWFKGDLQRGHSPRLVGTTNLLGAPL